MHGTGRRPAGIAYNRESARMPSSTIKGPAIFLAQFAGDAAPFNSLDAICGWAASLGFKGVQIPTWDGRLIDLVKAAESKAYCDELRGTAARHGVTSLADLGRVVTLAEIDMALADAFAMRFGPLTRVGQPVLATTAAAED